MNALPVVINDGGRRAAGFRGDAGDCVTRAIAIASAPAQPPSGDAYRRIYDDLAARRAATGKSRSAREGMPRPVLRRWFADHGWAWTPTMGIGTGCTVHLAAGELPDGVLVVSLSKHLCAVINGEVHDTHDPTHDGTRCVYGYWTPGGAR